MAKRLTTVLLVLTLCLALIPAQSFAVSAPKKAVIKEAPVSGEMAFNRDGLGLIEDKAGTRYLIDETGGIYREGKAWMDYDADSKTYVVDGEGYYGYPNGETLFTMEQMKANVKAFVEEHYPMEKVTNVEIGVTYPFSGPYATCSFDIVITDVETIKYEAYALIDKSGLVHYMTPLTDRTSGGGFPITYTLSENGEGLVQYTKEYPDWEGDIYKYESGYKDLDGNDVLVFPYESIRDPEDKSVTVIEDSGFTYFDDFHNGCAVVWNRDGRDSLIDRTGKVLLPFEHDSIYNDCGIYPVIYDEGKGWGYMDTAGVTVIPQEYEGAKGSWDNIFVVQKDRKWGVVDTDNKEVVPFEYDFMSSPDYGVVYACKGGKAYIITFEDVKEDDTLTPWGTKKVSAKFRDVPAGAWYETYLQSAVDNGIVGGTSDTTYTPGGNLTHAQIMVMVANLHSLAKGDKYDFQAHKTAGEHWAQTFRDYCKAEGIIDDRFDAKLDTKVTRAEMAYYFAHTLDDDYYLDKAEVSLSDIATEEYGGDILKLAKADIVGGYEVKGTTVREFRPSNYVTRAEAAVFVCNILGAIGPTGGIY
ncbi:MAG: S-layer homology domain-containing protein [Firmicutes bacterium]|nr:S-layer homology domain-containing protein [Bacillota bacterium]